MTQWYTTVNGKQHPLGVTDPAAQSAAVEALEALLKSLKSPGNAAPGTVGEAVSGYLAGAARKSAATYRGALHYCRKISVRYCTELVSAVSAAEVEAWVDGLSELGPDSRRNLLMCFEAVLKSAGRKLAFAKPPRGSRGADSQVSEAVYHQAVGCARGDLRAMLVVLWETGARPGELRKLTAEQVDWEQGVATLADHKTAHRTGKRRNLFLSAEAVKMLASQRDKYGGKGLLFRTRAGTAYTLPGLTQAVWRIAKRIGHPKLSAYGFRHSWATRALKGGVPDTHVAAVMGHTSTAMVHKHYSHVNADAKLLRDVVERVSRKAA